MPLVHVSGRMIIAQQFAGRTESNEPVRGSGRLVNWLGYLIQFSVSETQIEVRLQFLAMNRWAILIRPLTRTYWGAVEEKRY